MPAIGLVSRCSENRDAPFFLDYPDHHFPHSDENLRIADSRQLFAGSYLRAVLGKKEGQSLADKGFQFGVGGTVHRRDYTLTPYFDSMISQIL